MQIGNEQIKAQQNIMKAKGFYKGAIDGIWGPMTIEAKKKWELSGKYAPGLPNNGLPLGSKGPYPAGVYMKDGLLTCSELEVAKLQPVQVALEKQEAQADSSENKQENNPKIKFNKDNKH